MSAVTGFAELERWLLLGMFLILRPGAAIAAAPILGGVQVPMQLRVAMSLAIGLSAARHLPLASVPTPWTLDGVLAIAGELAIGAAIGLAAQVGFAAALTAGELLGGAMGLSFAALMDPLTGRPSQALGQRLTAIATLLFFIGDGHLLLLSSVAHSYDYWPVGASAELFSVAGRIAGLGSAVLGAAVSIAAPVLGAALMLQLVMAMLSRSAPQLNLFAVGLPATLMGGLVLLALAFPAVRAASDAAIGDGLREAQRVATRAP